MNEDHRSEAATEAAPDTQERAEAETRETQHHEEKREPERHGSIAGTLLTWLLLLLVGAGAAIWGLPKLAPHIPAPLAQYVLPAQQRDAEFQAGLDQRLNTLEARAAAAEKAARSAAERPMEDAETRARLGDIGATLQGASESVAAALRASEAASEAAQTALSRADAATETATLAREQAQQALGMASKPVDLPIDADARTGLAALEGRFDALAEAVKQLGSGDSAAAVAIKLAEADATLSRLSRDMAAQTEAGGALRATVEGVAARLAAVEARPAGAPAEIEALTGRVAELSQQAKDELASTADLARLSEQMQQLATRLEDAGEARAALADEVGKARRAARAGAAFAELERSAAAGERFAGSLAELQALGAAPPEAVAAAAENGAATYSALSASFDAAARRALDAVGSAETDSAVDSVFARLEARVTGLPSTPQAGDDPSSVLSRARAAIAARDAAGAVGELEALPEAGRAAMADWIDRAAARAALDAGLDAWRGDLRASL